jgi:hypothetical protein
VIFFLVFLSSHERRLELFVREAALEIRQCSESDPSVDTASENEDDPVETEIKAQAQNPIQVQNKIFATIPRQVSSQGCSRVFIVKGLLCLSLC